jgi:hypothetical protein
MLAVVAMFVLEDWTIDEQLRRSCRKLIIASGVREQPRPVLLIMVTFRLTGVAGSRLQEALPLF